MSGENWIPGPWEIEHGAPGTDEHGMVYVVHDGTSCPETTIWAGNVDCAEDYATALLIAAAPDLYAVLSELEESSGYWSEYDVPIGIVDRIKNTLKKARGNHE